MTIDGTVKGVYRSQQRLTILLLHSLVFELVVDAVSVQSHDFNDPFRASS